MGPDTLLRSVHDHGFILQRLADDKPAGSASRTTHFRYSTFYRPPRNRIRYSSHYECPCSLRQRCWSESSLAHGCLSASNADGDAEEAAVVVGTAMQRCPLPALPADPLWPDPLRVCKTSYPSQSHIAPGLRGVASKGVG